MKFSKRLEKLKTSEIREMLKVVEEKHLISLAGGLPDGRIFPIQEIQKITKEIMAENGLQALQYASTEGYLPLRDRIANRMLEVLQVQHGPENILIVNGAQQALDLTGKLYLDEDDSILCENPTYLGALNAFNAYHCNYVIMPSDEEGVLVDQLEKILINAPNIKLVYVNPDFQNPTGRSWSYKRRKAFMTLMNRFNLPIVEDNPYGEVTFRQDQMPSLSVWDQKNQVIYLGTFSKILCPGLRVGWVAASKDLIKKYVLLKQGMDLHTSILNQMIISKYLEEFDIQRHIEKIKRVYKAKRDLAIYTMERYFPQEVTFTRPEGGMFIWVELPEDVDVKEVLNHCIENGVAFVPGNAFFPNDQKHNFMRINYSNPSEEDLVIGLQRIGKVLQEVI